jgi:hypothetical protein
MSGSRTTDDHRSGASGHKSSRAVSLAKSSCAKKSGALQLLAPLIILPGSRKYQARLGFAHELLVAFSRKTKCDFMFSSLSIRFVHL